MLGFQCSIYAMLATRQHESLQQQLPANSTSGHHGPWRWGAQHSSAGLLAYIARHTKPWRLGHLLAESLPMTAADGHGCTTPLAACCSAVLLMVRPQKLLLSCLSRKACAMPMQTIPKSFGAPNPRLTVISRCLASTVLLAACHAAHSSTVSA